MPQTAFFHRPLASGRQQGNPTRAVAAFTSAASSWPGNLAVLLLQEIVLSLQRAGLSIFCEQNWVAPAGVTGKTSERIT